MVKRLVYILVAFLTATGLAATHVAVLETVSENGVIGRSEKMFLTDKIRERAKAVLPAYMGYVVMTRENINAMLPPGKSIEECEGSCLVETGKNISADYVAQARVGKFGKQLTLTMELYETAGNNLVGSFTTRKPNAEGLLEEIEREADRIFAQIVGTGAPAVGGSEGISGISTGGNGYRASGVKSYIVRVESSPAGAMFSTDGRVNASCNRTPCDITLPAGNHRFSFSMDMYFDKDETVDVRSNGQKVLAELVPNFGELTIAPVFDGGMGNLGEAEILIDGKKMQGGSFRLSVGSHKVQISHRCYETVSFNASVKNGSKIRFDQAMQPLLGGLEMEALLDDKPKSMPVYVNGKKMGETPFLETVPVCAKVQIGNGREDIPVKLKAGETVKFTYKGNGSTLVDKRDGKKYKTVKIGNQTWMAENLNYKTQDSYCYRNDESNCSKYGRLYKWEAAVKVCPIGWHLPSKKELEKLFSSVGGEEVAGKSLKFKKGWNNGGNGTDAFGFSALPAGGRNVDGDYGLKGEVAYFWSSTEDTSYRAYYMGLYDEDDDAGLDNLSKYGGMSVRCLKD
jgi:uncharacterized protein (TIGR02145 family)